MATIAIEIAPPGEYFVKTIYNVEKDIADYNNIIKKCENERFMLLHPYLGYEPQKFLLEDGHHLNDFGLELVFIEVDKVLQELIGDKGQDK